MTTLTNITFAITFTATRANLSIPWFVDTLTPNTPDANIAQNICSMMNSVPGITEYTESRPKDSLEMTVSFNFNEVLANNIQPLSQEELEFFTNGGNLANIILYARQKLNSTELNNYYANLAAFGQTHSYQFTFDSLPIGKV